MRMFQLRKNSQPTENGTRHSQHACAFAAARRITVPCLLGILYNIGQLSVARQFVASVIWVLYTSTWFNSKFHLLTNRLINRILFARYVIPWDIQIGVQTLARYNSKSGTFSTMIDAR